MLAVLNSFCNIKTCFQFNSNFVLINHGIYKIIMKHETISIMQSQ